MRLDAWPDAVGILIREVQKHNGDLTRLQSRAGQLYAWANENREGKKSGCGACGLIAQEVKELVLGHRLENVVPLDVLAAISGQPCNLFGALDTFGEIAVVVIAALSAYALLRTTKNAGNS